ncbi:MAG: KH domain-containing protein [Armatimonadota bacterium]
MKELIEYLVRSLVDSPDQVDIRELDGADITTYEIHVAPADLGKVIGKQGKIANALRTVVKAAAMKSRKRVYIEIIP